MYQTTTLTQCSRLQLQTEPQDEGFLYCLVGRAFRSFLTPDLLIVDHLGLHRLTAQQSADLYELILNRHRVSSFVITSNRAVEEWPSLFEDPILGNSALDRLANASYRVVFEGSSYRERLSPHRALLDPLREGGD